MLAIFVIVCPFLSVYIAQRKGFAPLRWFATWGPIGTVVLLLLPSARLESLQSEESKHRALQANKWGAWLCGTNLIFAGIVAVGTLGWFVFTGHDQGPYLAHIPELDAMGENSFKSEFKVDGFVVPDSIQAMENGVSFQISDSPSNSLKHGRLLKVVYEGPRLTSGLVSGDSPVLVEGKYGRDFVFRARTVERNIASGRTE